jgi:ABC-2 type transport system permease protein
MHLRSVIIWSVAVTTLILVFFPFFSVFSDQAVLMNQLLERFPAQMRAAFGLDNLDLTTTLGFLAFIFLFVQLCLAIQAGNYGVGLVSLEETELTADFLLTRPVSRVQVLTSKLLAALLSLTITNAVVWGASLLAVTLFSNGKPYQMRSLLLLLASIGIFQLFFLSVGLLISLLVRRVRSVTPYSMGLGFGAYVLSAFTGIFDDVALELLTPFKHLDAAYIVKHGEFDIPLVLLNLAVSLTALAVSYWLFKRRDIHAVS